MKRLNESRKDLDEGELLLADLVEAFPRTRTDPFRKRRIRAQVQSAPHARGRGGSHIGGRTAMVAGLLCVATAAAAMIGGVKLLSRADEGRSVGVKTSEATRAASSTSRASFSPATPAAAPSTHLEPTSNEIATRLVTSSGAERATSVSTATPRNAPPAVSSSAAATGEDPSLVAAAIRALRSDNEPARARSLLAQYLKSNPRGALAEEALALSIEAAVKMRDPQASSLARTYLRAYPKGRHRGLAENVLAR
ncbi:MAG: hypothetical protein QM784_01355 [Polyangiaceae bacterium]